MRGIVLSFFQVGILLSYGTGGKTSSELDPQMKPIVSIV